MEFTKTMAFLLLMIAAVGISMADEKQVDWTVGKDYKDWTSDNKFYVGDTLVFQYDAKYHNVLQVNKKDYKSCSTTSPMASYSSGSDSIALTIPGEYYFICAYPGHCESGQKLKIKVHKCDNNEGQTSPDTPAQNYPYPPPVRPRHSSSPLSAANWLTAIKAFVGILVASYFCGLSL